MKTRGMRRYVMGAASLVLVALAWFFLAPQQLGGDVAYMVITGNSMEPLLHADDLVVVRAADEYGVGDAVAYNSDNLGRLVLHRIVEREGDRYILRGDNNDFLDSDRPAEEDLVGKLWFAVPRAGVALKQLRQPVGWAILGMAAAGVLGLFGATRRRRRGSRGRHRAGDRRPSSTPAAVARTRRAPVRKPVRGGVRGSTRKVLQVAAASSAALFLVASATAAFAYAQPIKRATIRKVAYEQRGTFDYSASAPKGPVYPDRKVSTGEPVFLRLIDQVAISFAYEFASAAPHAVRPTGRMFVELSDPATGWSRRIPLAARETRTGERLVLAAELDVAALRSLAGRVQKLTGVEATSSALEIVPSIHAEGVLEGHPLNAEFSPVLGFTLDDLQLKLAATAPEGESVGAVDPLIFSEEQTMAVETDGPNRISLSAITIAVEQLRTVALVIGGIALLVLTATGLVLILSGNDEASRIEARYGSMIVPLSEMPTPMTAPIDVASIDALSKVAEQLGHMILHFGSGARHTYLVPSEGTFYRYRTRGQARQEVPADEAVAVEPRSAPPPPAAVKR